MDEYKKYLAVWELIRQLNRARIFDYGYATHNSNGDAVIYFDTPEQKEKYQSVFN